MSSAVASFAVLLAVIVSIPLVLWLVRRLSQLPGGHTHAALRVQASLTLGARERIAVVKVGERALLLGITGESINLLTELDAPLPDEAAAASPRGFATLLDNLQKKRP
ncbi:MAG: flagellar biosynthetic protein FliO [Lautropia sp.]|nr:flagellar biosynthetic protein FliO [Lautropia sp.]